MMRLNIKIVVAIVLSSIIPISLSHLADFFPFDDFIRILCFIFCSLALPAILVAAYQKLIMPKRGIRYIYYLIMLFQSLLTILLLDGEGMLLLEELNGGEGQQIVIIMLMVPLVFFIVYFLSRKLFESKK